LVAVARRWPAAANSLGAKNLIRYVEPGPVGAKNLIHVTRPAIFMHESAEPIRPLDS
jgi:hypothetical protein